MRVRVIWCHMFFSHMDRARKYNLKPPWGCARAHLIVYPQRDATIYRYIKRQLVAACAYY